MRPRIVRGVYLPSNVPPSNSAVLPAFMMDDYDPGLGLGGGISYNNLSWKDSTRLVSYVQYVRTKTCSIDRYIKLKYLPTTNI